MCCRKGVAFYRKPIDRVESMKILRLQDKLYCHQRSSMSRQRCLIFSERFLKRIKQRTMAIANESTLPTATPKSTREVSWPREMDRHEYPSEIFGRNVFTMKTLQQTLPKPVYARFVEQIKVRSAELKESYRSIFSQFCRRQMCHLGTRASR
jgi:hypothetical protein